MSFQATVYATKQEMENPVSKRLHIPKTEDSIEYINKFILDRDEKIRKYYQKMKRWMNQIKEAEKLRKQKKDG